MGLIDRVLDAFDAPRFCPDDGKAIEVEAIPVFDPKTGQPAEPLYLWHCPEVSAWIEGRGGGEWSQHGVAALHAHGMGRPRWHRLSEAR